MPLLSLHPRVRRPSRSDGSSSLPSPSAACRSGPHPSPSSPSSGLKLFGPLDSCLRVYSAAQACSSHLRASSAADDAALLKSCHYKTSVAQLITHVTLKHSRKPRQKQFLVVCPLAV